MGVEAFSCQFLVLACGSIEYCGKVIGRGTGYLIAGGHRETDIGKQGELGKYVSRE